MIVHATYFTRVSLSIEQVRVPKLVPPHVRIVFGILSPLSIIERASTKLVSRLISKVKVGMLVSPPVRKLIILEASAPKIMFTIFGQLVFRILVPSLIFKMTLVPTSVREAVRKLDSPFDSTVTVRILVPSLVIEVHVGTRITAPVAVGEAARELVPPLVSYVAVRILFPSLVFVAKVPTMLVTPVIKAARELFRPFVSEVAVRILVPSVVIEMSVSILVAAPVNIESRRLATLLSCDLAVQSLNLLPAIYVLARKLTPPLLLGPLLSDPLLVCEVMARVLVFSNNINRLVNNSDKGATSCLV